MAGPRPQYARAAAEVVVSATARGAVASERQCPLCALCGSGEAGAIPRLVHNAIRPPSTLAVQLTWGAVRFCSNGALAERAVRTCGASLLERARGHWTSVAPGGDRQGVRRGPGGKKPRGKRRSPSDAGTAQVCPLNYLRRPPCRPRDRPPGREVWWERGCAGRYTRSRAGAFVCESAGCAPPL